MKRPVIAVDIDDVLVDSAASILGDYNKKYGTSLTKNHYYSKDIKVLEVEHYDIAAERFGKYIASKEYTDMPPISGAVSAINRLSSRYDFVGVTSRPEFIAEATNKWLKKHFKSGIIKAIYTSFVMGSVSQQSSILTKAGVCQELGASYMIEDHLGHVLPVSELDITVFLIDQPWNQAGALPKNVIRVKNWLEIEKYLDGR